MKKNIFLKPFYRSLIAFTIMLIDEKIGFTKYSIPSIDPVPWSIFFAEGIFRAFYFSLAFFLCLCLWEFRKVKSQDKDAHK